MWKDRSWIRNTLNNHWQSAWKQWDHYEAIPKILEDGLWRRASNNGAGLFFCFGMEYVKNGRFFRSILHKDAGLEYSGSYHGPRLVTTSSTWYMYSGKGMADTRSGPRFPEETLSWRRRIGAVVDNKCARQRKRTYSHHILTYFEITMAVGLSAFLKTVASWEEVVGV